MMNNQSNQSISPFDLASLRTEAERIATDEEHFSTTEEIDAFLHTYTSAVITWQYGTVAGLAYADILGLGYEAVSMAAVLGQNALGALLNPLGADIFTFETGHEIRSSIMDIYNNNIGVAIGSTATSKEDIKSKVANAVRSGQVITSPDRLEDERKKLPQSPHAQSFVEGDGMWESPSRASSIDTGSLIRAISGGKGKMSSKQIFAMSAAAFAQELIKSRRRSLENDLLDILTSSNGKNTLAQAGSGNSMSSLPNVFGGIIDNLVGSAMSRRKTRTSTAESARSIEASRNWQPSRSQQQSMLAQWAQQGNRNL